MELVDVPLRTVPLAQGMGYEVELEALYFTYLPFGKVFRSLERIC
jgi:hypothetical protein